MSTSPDARPAGLPTLESMSQYLSVVENLPGWRRIGDVLVDLGYLTEDQIATGLKAQRRLIVSRQQSTGLLEVLQDLGLITAAQAQNALGYQIANFYLPALAQALQSRDQAIDELRQTYQLSLQTIAAYAEEASRVQSEASELRSRVSSLEAELGAGRSEGRPNR